VVISISFSFIGVGELTVYGSLASADSYFLQKLEYTPSGYYSRIFS